jgi:hypothetical protein
MSEEMPVPRRESPWGLPEGDKRQPKAHRCNDRAEDVVQVLKSLAISSSLHFALWRFASSSDESSNCSSGVC